MYRKEFFEWLETCPTHKWEVNDEFGDIGAGYIVVSFPTEEEEEEEEEEEKDVCLECGVEIVDGGCWGYCDPCVEKTGGIPFEAIDLLEATRQRIAEQGRIVDSRLLSKEKMLEQLLINWENET